MQIEQEAVLISIGAISILNLAALIGFGLWLRKARADQETRLTEAIGGGMQKLVLSFLQRELGDLGRTTKASFARAAAQMEESHSELAALLEDRAVELAGMISASIVANRLQDEKNNYSNKNIVIESGELVKYFSGCELTSMTDHSTGQETRLEYEDGMHVRSQTFEHGRLKYVMHYEDETLQQIDEFGPEGEQIAEYHYDEAGEVIKRIETI